MWLRLTQCSPNSSLHSWMHKQAPFPSLPACGEGQGCQTNVGGGNVQFRAGPSSSDSAFPAMIALEVACKRTSGRKALRFWVLFVTTAEPRLSWLILALESDGCVWILSLSLVSCVTLNKLLNFSVPQSPYWNNNNNRINNNRINDNKIYFKQNIC